MRKVGGWLSGSLDYTRAFRLRNMSVRSSDIWETPTINPSGTGFLLTGRFFFFYSFNLIACYRSV